MPKGNGFSSHYSFHYHLLVFVRWTLSLPGLGSPRQVSTPSSFDAWLGVAIGKGFTEFEGIRSIIPN